MSNNELSKRVAELMGYMYIQKERPYKEGIWRTPEGKLIRESIWNIETAEAQMAFIEWWVTHDDVDREYTRQSEGNIHRFTEYSNGDGYGYTGETLLEAIRSVVDTTTEEVE